MKAILHCQALVAGYDGHEIVRNIDFNIQPGEIVCLLGRNGSGKSTLIRALLGRVAIFSGTLEYNGESMIGLKAHQISRLGIGYVPADRGCFDELTIKENMRIAGLVALQSEVENQVYQIFPFLEERCAQKAGSLSGGEKQMLVLAMALIRGPQLLLVDELSQGLQPSKIKDLLKLVRALVDHRGMSVFFVDQSVHISQALGDRAYFLDRGKITCEYSSKELVAQARYIEQKLAL